MGATPKALEAELDLDGRSSSSSRYGSSILDGEVE